MNVLKDIPRVGNRLLAVRRFSNGAKMHSPSMAALILCHLPYRVEIGGDFNEEPSAEMTEFVEELDEGCWFAETWHGNKLFGNRIYAFETEKAAMMFKMRFG